MFLKFCKLLHIKLDPIDPSLYIHRFASMLEFADKTQQVPISAHRRVYRSALGLRVIKRRDEREGPHLAHAGPVKNRFVSGLAG